MKTQFQILHDRPRSAAGLAAIVLGAAAITALVDWSPALAEHPAVALASAPAPAAKARCVECGVIVSKREIDTASGEVSPKSSVNSDPNSSRNSSLRYEFTVRMGDGSSRVFDDVSPANWRDGERVTIIGGASRAMR
jgi:hypothetical protein